MCKGRTIRKLIGGGTGEVQKKKKKIHTRNLVTKKVATAQKKNLEPYTLTCSPLKGVYLLICLSIDDPQKSPFNILVALEISMHLF